MFPISGSLSPSSVSLSSPPLFLYRGGKEEDGGGRSVVAEGGMAKSRRGDISMRDDGLTKRVQTEEQRACSQKKKREGERERDQPARRSLPRFSCVLVCMWLANPGQEPS